MLTHREFESLDEFFKLTEFADIGISIAASKAIDQAIQRIMEKIGEHFAPMTWAVLLLDRDGGAPAFKFVSGRNAEKLKDRIVSPALIPGVGGAFGDGGKPVSAPETGRAGRPALRLDDVLGFPVRSLLTSPLVCEGRIKGVVLLINPRNDGRDNGDDAEVLHETVEFAGAAMEKIYYLSAQRDFARSDPLTRVYNRRSFEARLAEAMDRCKRYGHQLAFMLADIDDLQEINERRGHTAGDEILRDFARLMKKNLRPIDIIGRFDDDRFAVILPYAKRHEGEVVRQRILRDIEERNRSRGGIPYTATVGLHAAGPDRVAELVSLTEEDLERQRRGDG